ncbi:plasmid partitioning protein RepB C-terminal domain-containing protein [Bradyrhizobium elkanii]|uniref:plasmid partitioning protein RepB C-terminal domain-containing protein n=1 Tax=Bradyrhizobium elkanii TaxID=29448 RepID=UPI001930AAD6|nr:plasmid partitioning protein RepB C-terminal domain-containing protein [Bradyrhizobium elkanii]
MSTLPLDRGDTEVECILADDDEAFTYNNRINRIGAVQEHFLILRAIERGISEEKLATALGVQIEAVRRRQRLLKGISSEAATLLMDKRDCSHTASRLFCKSMTGPFALTRHNGATGRMYGSASNLAQAEQRRTRFSLKYPSAPRHADRPSPRHFSCDTGRSARMVYGGFRDSHEQGLTNCCRLHSIRRLIQLLLRKKEGTEIDT